MLQAVLVLRRHCGLILLVAFWIVIGTSVLWPAPVWGRTEIRAAVTGENISDIADRFNRSQSDYKVTVHHQNFRNWRFAVNRFRFMQQRAASGDTSALIDIFFLDNSWLPAMIRQNWLADLSGKIPGSGNFVNGLIEAATTDGALYGLPFSTKGLVLFFRKDLHLKHHLPAPKTLPELARNAQVLMTREPLDHGLTIHESAIHLDILPFLWSNGGDIISGNRVVLNSPANIETLTYLQSLKQKEILPSNAVFNELKGAYTNAKKQFLAGKSAYIITWNNRSDDFEKGPLSGRVGVLPIPTLKPDQTAYSVIGSWYFAINSLSRNKAGAIAFLDYFYTPQTQRYLALKSNAYLPVLKSAYQDAEILARNRYIKPFQAALANMRHRLWHPDEPEIELILENMVREILIGAGPVKPLLLIAEKRIKAILNKNS